MGKEITVMTYNIHHGVGIDGRLDLNRIATVIKNTSADIIGIQEVDRFFSERSNYQDQANELASLLGFEYVYGANLDYEPMVGLIDNRQYGIATLSRYPIVDSSHYFLPSSKTEQRGLLHSQIQIDGKNIHVFNVHLGLMIEERLAQVKKMKDIVESFSGPQILIGDFNAEPSSDEIEMVQKKIGLYDSLKSRGDISTFPSNNPTKRIDYIFASNRVNKAASRVIQSQASDHLPIITNIKL